MRSLFQEKPTAATASAQELLLCCARTRLEAAHKAWIAALLQRDLAWPHLLQLAGRHGVTALLHRSLSAACPDAVPAAIWAKLRDQARLNRARSLYLTQALPSLLRSLEAQAIPVAPFKGPVLAFSVYGDPGLRSFSDLDILIHKRDLPRTQQLLQAAGYRADSPSMSSEQHFTRRADRLAVDLHWGIPVTVHTHLDPESWWPRLVRTSLAGTSVLSLGPEESLLLACVNMAKDPWKAALKDVCDVAELIRAHPALNWGSVLREARRCRCERLLFTALLLANELLEAALPAEVGRRLKLVRGVRALAATLRTRLFRGDLLSGSRLDIYLWDLRKMDCFRDRLRYSSVVLRRDVLTPTPHERALLPLPAALSFLYVALRPLRLIGKYGNPCRFLPRFRTPVGPYSCCG